MYRANMINGMKKALVDFMFQKPKIKMIMIKFIRLYKVYKSQVKEDFKMIWQKIHD